MVGERGYSSGKGESGIVGGGDGDERGCGATG